jgi:hypothetical protein
LEHGKTDYNTETMPISFKADFRESDGGRWTGAVTAAANPVLNGLKKDRKSGLGLNNRPRSSVSNVAPFSSRDKRFSIVAELLNDKNKVVGTQTFNTSGSWSSNFDSGISMKTSTSGVRTITFPRVNVYDITERMTIRFASVDDKAADTVAKSGVLQITTEADYRDANGFNYDGGGYGWDGYSKAGHDKDGYTRNGFDRGGFNRAGNDKSGYDKDGYNGLWFNIGAYFDWHFVNIFDQSSELEIHYIEKYGSYTNEDGTEVTYSNIYKQWLYGGKIGMDSGVRHFTIGAYFAIAGYDMDYISKSDASDYGTIGGFGYGGDFSVEYSIYENVGAAPLLRVKISTDVTLLHFPENPLNVPTIPYLRLTSFFAVFTMGLKLELPVINVEVSPRFGLEFGLAGGWSMKRK